MTKKQIMVVTGALLLSNAMIGLDGTIINTALPAIISDLNGIEYMGWMVAIFLLAMAVSTPLWSKLGERIGNKIAYQIATLLFAAGAVLQGLSGSIVFFLISRAFMGIGAGGMNTMPFIIYADLYTDLRKRSNILGLATASYSAASIIGPLLGGLIVDTVSWHWVFYLNVPIALFSVLIVQIFFKEPARVILHKKVDYLGASVMIISLSFLLTGIQMLETASPLIVIGLLLIGLSGLILLLKIEEKAVDPIIPNRLFKNPQLVLDFLLFAILWGSFIAFNIYVPMWAQGLLGTTALIGGATQIPSSITNFIGAFIGPAMRPKIGKYPVVAVGSAAFLIAFAGMSFLGVDAPLWLLLIFGVFEGLGLGFSFNILQVSVQEDAESQDVPVATSFAYLVRILAQTFMTSVFGLLMNHSLFAGVKNSEGRITMDMMNALSNSNSVGSLPQNLLPEMRGILHQGIHNIMLVATALVIIALVVNIWGQKKWALKQ